MGNGRYSVPMISALALGPMPDIVRSELGERAFARVLRASGIPYDVAAERRGYVPEAAVVRFLDGAARDAGQQWLASTWAPQISVDDYGTWGAYVLSAPTLKAAYQRSAQSIRLHATEANLSLRVESGWAEVCARFATMSTRGYAELPMPAVGAICSIGRHFLGPGWTPLRVCVNIPRPAARDREMIEAIVGCPVIFDDDAIRVFFDASDLAATRPRPGAGPPVTFQDLVRERAAEIPETFVDQVQSIIRYQLSDQAMSVDEVAEALGLAVRTLQRRLGEDGLNFRQLTRQTRLQRAKELLNSDALSITQIAFELGYSSPGHFSRMFQRATGRPPSAFRDEPIPQI